MITDLYVAWLVFLIAFNSECNGKYVANNLPDLFPITEFGSITAKCESNNVVSECDDNLNYAIDGNSKTFWRSPSLINGNEFPEVNLTFNFDQVNFEERKSAIFNKKKKTKIVQNKRE